MVNKDLNVRPSPVLAAWLEDNFSESGHFWPLHIRVSKRVFDLSMSLIALPLVVGVGAVLLVVNPFLNPGPLLFSQVRMGKNARPFMLVKFRTMVSGGGALRGHDDDVEEDRIRPLGRILRKFRIDELPNFFNVLAGDMSVIGPRPDMLEHAIELSKRVPRYKDRFRVKPGISGLAQVRHGYVSSLSGVARKARLDAIYIEYFCLGLEVFIIAQTFLVILTGFRAR